MYQPQTIINAYLKFLRKEFSKGVIDSSKLNCVSIIKEYEGFTISKDYVKECDKLLNEVIRAFVAENKMSNRS